MMPVIELNIDEAVTALTEGLDDKEKDIRRAVNRAENKFVQWAIRQIVQFMSRASSIPQRKLKDNQRIFVRKNRTPEGLLTNLWLGLNPIYADQLGKPVKTDVGVKIGRYGEFYQAFIVTKGNVYYRLWHHRLPIKRALYAFSDPVLQAIDRFQIPAQRRFVELLKQEINYAINHE